MNATSVAAACALGLVLGCRHAFEPDHLAAVAAMVSDGRGRGSGTRSVRRAAGVGALWGLGHSLALLVVATVLAALRAEMPAYLTTGLEIVVGVLLVGLAVHLMRRGTAMHAVATRDLEPPSGDVPRKRELTLSVVRPLVVGLVHGLAGSGALVALVATTIDDPGARVAHVALFGLGSTVAMAALSGAAGIPVAVLSARHALARWLRAAAAVLSATTGIVWIASALAG